MEEAAFSPAFAPPPPPPPLLLLLLLLSFSNAGIAQAVYTDKTPISSEDGLNTTK